MGALVLGTRFNTALRAAGSDRVKNERHCNVTENRCNWQSVDFGTSNSDQRYGVVCRNAASGWDKGGRDNQDHRRTQKWHLPKPPSKWGR
jgi:hypothetical protein